MTLVVSIDIEASGAFVDASAIVKNETVVTGSAEGHTSNASHTSLACLTNRVDTSVTRGAGVLASVVRVK